MKFVKQNEVSGCYKHKITGGELMKKYQKNDFVISTLHN